MRSMHKTTTEFLNRDFWIEENLKYAQPHFRLEKCARIVNKISGGERCDLLDVGCGPATLRKFLGHNINYHGIDIAIHNPAPNLLEMDFAKEEIRFGDKKFDIIVAAGVFEYLGGLQKKKLSEIRSILGEQGRFVVTFTNFNHLHYLNGDCPYNNIQSIPDFKRALQEYFRVDSSFPHAHNWMSTEPRRRWLKQIQTNLYLNIPVVSPRLGLGYFFICSPRP